VPSATSTSSVCADIDKLSRRIANKRLVKPEKINQARLKERYPRVARYYNLSHDAQTASLTAAFDADKHAKAERLDGCYLLKTNRKDLSGNELWRKGKYKCRHDARADGRSAARRAATSCPGRESLGSGGQDVDACWPIIFSSQSRKHFSTSCTAAKIAGAGVRKA
jgi:hypothetical protein